MDPILELRDLVKEYPGERAVDSVSLTIPRGGFFSLLGPSGCGKTTTLRMIAGFEAPTSGEVRLSGAVVNGRRPYERNVSTVFQSYALFPHLSAQENIEFGLRRRRADGIAKKVAAVLDLVRLAGKEKRRPSELSGGERQRVALARSLVIEPDVLLLDEPLAALDPKLRKQMRIELKELQRRVGITFLLVTHDQEEALSMSDQLAVMNAGRVEQVGTPEDIYLRPRTRFVAGFLGGVNWIGEAGLRPEAIRISRPGQRTAACWRPAVVTGSVFLGNCVQVMARLESGEEAVAEVPRDLASFQKGEAVEICWHPHDEMRFE
jgi:ABC-type Fe3+/spermidine/putrescine transport system ATPase subunit